MMINDDVFETFKRFVEGGKKTPTTIGKVVVGGHEVALIAASDGTVPDGDGSIRGASLDVWRAITGACPGQVRMRVYSPSTGVSVCKIMEGGVDRNSFLEILNPMVETFVLHRIRVMSSEEST